MKQNSEMGTVRVLGIDLGKRNFHVHGVDERGVVVLRRRFSRQGLLEAMVQMPPCLIGMEACGGAHYWARTMREFGHTVRLMAPQFVKPYVKSNKNDSLDAEAICEAVARPNMRFVSIKTVPQQDVQSLHRIRSLAMTQRTALINQIRGLLQEYGIVMPQGAHQVRRGIHQVLEDSGCGLSPMMREMVRGLYDELVHQEERIANHDTRIEELSRTDENCRRLRTIPGIGPMIATALMASVGNAGEFRSGREMSAWLGLIPRQHSTGGKAWLLGISKRGNTYLRTLLIHGARSALRLALMKPDESRKNRWLANLAARRGNNVAAVALANKNARTAWALLTRGEGYRDMTPI